jgi:hypothetical protein
VRSVGKWVTGAVFREPFERTESDILKKMSLVGGDCDDDLEVMQARKWGYWDVDDGADVS